MIVLDEAILSELELQALIIESNVTFGVKST